MGSAETQGALWSTGARAWADLLERQHAPIYEAAFDAIGLSAGVNLLDAGCGAGLAMERARVRGATVSGLDASIGLLEIAKERMPLVDLRQGDIESLPYDDDGFDAVTAFNSVQFAENPTAALEEIRRVCKPGGAIAVVTWAPIEENDIRVIFESLAPLIPKPPPDTTPPSPFAIAKRGEMEGRMEDAGMQVADPIEVPVDFSYLDHETALRGMLATGPGMTAVSHAGEERARELLGVSLGQFVRDDGQVILNNKFRVLPATA